MAFKTLMTVTAPGHGNADVERLVDLCEETGAHLSVLLLGLVTPPPVDFIVAADDPWFLQRQGEVRAIEERARALSSHLLSRNVSVDVASDLCEVSRADSVTGRRARYADLAILGPELLADDDYKPHAVKGVLFSSGTPLLLAPKGIKVTLKPQRVMIAWNGGLEEARAVRASIDLLKGAAEVTVILVDPQIGERHHGEEPGADIAAYLARHGINVRVVRVPKSGSEVAEVLQNQARDWCADILVMGAYGHSRLREWIFGGTTRTMLDGCAVPVLMAH